MIAPNPNHNLWNNNGTWFVHCTVGPTPYTKERLRLSLHTKSVEVARRRRDKILTDLHDRGLLRSRPSVHLAEAALGSQGVAVISSWDAR